MYVFKSGSEKETEQIGLMLGERLKGKEIIALYGGLGMGKTAITRGISDYFGLKEYVSSPTFAIVNEYDGRYKIYHFDMYRIKNLDDLESTGFYDYIDNGIIIIEWSENIEYALPKEVIRVRFEKGINDNDRNISIEGIDLI